MKRKISTLALLATSLFATAAPRSAADALKVARQFVAQTPALRSLSNMQMTLSSSIAADAKAREGAAATPAYYVVNLEDSNGFVIVSGDDRFRPVLGYSTSGNVNAGDALPDGLEYWLNFLSDEMKTAIANGYEAPAMETRVSSSAYDTSIAPLITTKWGQSSPFNNKIPNYVTGCVATGMAQVMKYWEYPTRGIGAHTNSYFKVYSADFGATTYDWANMKDEYGGKYDTKAEVDAVATLMLHLGIATDMRWTDDNSATPNMFAAYALINNFGYNKNLYAEGRDYMSLGAWKALIIDQLRSGHPLCYSGMTSEASGAGHFFVLDGYDAQSGKFHFNWGWDGRYDGYYDITALEPGAIGEAGSLSGSYNYYQQMFVNVQPEECGEPTAKFDANKIYPIHSTCEKNSVGVRTIKLSNSAVNFKGSIGLAIYNADGSLYKFEACADNFPGNLSLGSSYSGEQDFAVNLSEVADGTYTVCLATLREDLLDKPFPVRAFHNNATYYKMTISGNQASFEEIKSAYYIADTAAPAVINSAEANTAYHNVASSFIVTVKNSGTTEFFDEVGVCIKKNRDSNPQYITVPCSLAPGEEKTITVTGIVAREPGTYSLVACYGENGEYSTLDNSVSITIKDEADAISSVPAEAGNSAIYTLMGVRVSNTESLPKGIYISNGKKYTK